MWNLKVWELNYKILKFRDLTTNLLKVINGVIKPNNNGTNTMSSQ